MPLAHSVEREKGQLGHFWTIMGHWNTKRANINHSEMLELAGIIILGIIAQWVAWKFKFPAILPLIVIGLLVGPIATLYTDDGSKIIEPIWNGEKGLFPMEGLYNFVSLSIGVILFKEGLTLKRDDISNVRPVITKLITVGTLVTFLGSGAAVHYIFELSWQISFLFGGLMVVGGPTIVANILRNVPTGKALSTIMKWEGTFLDPIGALLAVLVFEFINVGGKADFSLMSLVNFAKIVLFSTMIGFVFAHALRLAIKKNVIPHYLLNVVSLSTVLLVFVTSDVFAQESGLLAVVVMGMVLGNMDFSGLEKLFVFKESLSVLLVSILFILLAANIDIGELELLYDWKTVALFAVVVFLIRPLGVFLGTRGSNLRPNEKLFIGWVGPRGIVAVGIASLFGSKLLANGEPGAEFITPLVFTIVLGTVLINATTARRFAKLVGVYLKRSEGIIIIGASLPSRLIGHYLQGNDRQVVLVDNNRDNVQKARKLGLEAMVFDVYSHDLSDHMELGDMGYLMALTENSDINQFVMESFKGRFGANRSFRLVNSEEMVDPGKNTKQGLFSHTDDYIALTEAARKNPTIHEITLKDRGHYEGLLAIMKADRDIVPIFLKTPEGELRIIPSNGLVFTDIKEGCKLVYLGKGLGIVMKDGLAPNA